MKVVVETRIELLRGKMVEMAQKKGLTDPEVIAISQEIDHLHNQWNNLFWAMREEFVSFISDPYWYYDQAEASLEGQGKL